jgi:uncharacterized protein YbjT (DUF2867 family)
MAKILVTGATGFVGKRLIYYLLEEGHEIYALCRIHGTKVFTEEKDNLHYLWGDLRNPETLQAFPKELDAAYYLVHSMSEIVNNLSQTEVQVAENFLEGLQNTRVKQLIYLGGIINDEKKLSPHLHSRLLVEKTLMSSLIPTTILRASIIIGSGSASFEIIRDLCEKLPIMIAPRWLQSLCQPIAIQDVIFYLSKVLLEPKCYHSIFDIGGPEILSFKNLLLEYSAYRQLKRYIINVPFLTPYLSSFWMVFITSVRFSLCRYLVESIKTNSVVQLKGLQAIIPHQCLPFKKTLELAFQNIAQNEVISTWMDSWEIEGLTLDLKNYIEVPIEGCLKDEQRFTVQDSQEAALDRIWRIGGNRGYYAFNWAWKLRGWADRMIGGVGLNRGRRHPINLQEGDSIDFWRVLLADKKKAHLILFAGMKVPGEAWLEFKLKAENEKWILIQKATFRPKGVLGRIYWYCLIPFHFFIFRKMAKTLAGYV